jgi:hypothetical protein
LVLFVLFFFTDGQGQGILLPASFWSLALSFVLDVDTLVHQYLAWMYMTETERKEASGYFSSLLSPLSLSLTHTHTKTPHDSQSGISVVIISQIVQSLLLSIVQEIHKEYFVEEEFF